MKKVWFFACILLVGMALFALTLPAFGQEVTASIVGTVTDPSGAPISAAAVTATDIERGTTWTAKTNDAGAYNLTRVPIGTYKVEIAAPGFQKAVHPPFTLVLNQTARVDVAMKVGQVTETIEVTGTAPVLQTENAQVSTIIDAKTNDNLPLATRNFIQLTLLTPGAISVDPQSMNTGANLAEEGGRPYINGNREQANNFLLDGLDNNQASENLAGFTPSPDAIGEFNLITQNASAEFGNYNGGIINATIKSGTNSLHGNLFEFFRNDKFNANKWENGLGVGTPVGVLPTPKLRWNMFGGTIGGPIVKNKLFFFGDYQGGRLDFPSSSSGMTVLTPDEIGGNFGALLSTGVQLYNPCAAGTGGTSGTPCNILAPASRPAFAGNVIPANMLDPVFTALVTNPLYPKSVNSLPNGFGNAINTTAKQFNTDQGDLKIDYDPSERDRFFGRFSKSDQYDPQTNSQAILGNIVNEAYILSGGINWTHTFSPKLLNEFRIGENWTRLPHGLTAFNASVGKLAESIGIADGNPGGLTGLPLLAFGGGAGTNPNTGTLADLGSAGVTEKFSSTVEQLTDNLIYTHGRHAIKLGYQMNYYKINAFYSGNGGELGILIYGLGPNGNYSGNGTNGDPAADWALGLPQDVARGTSAENFWHQRDWLFAGYAQDDWRVTDDLTLNVGLRYEARTPWVEQNDRQDSVNILTGTLQYPGRVPVQGVGSNGFSRGLYKSEYGLPDFQPRVGFAYSPSALNHKTVLRGAYTISSYLEGTGTNLRTTQNPPFTPPQVEAANTAAGPGYGTANAFTSATGNLFQGATMLAWSGTVQPAIAQQWNFSIQHEIANNTTLQVGYVGQHTTHLMVPEWLKQGDLHPDGTITYPYIGGQNPAGGFGPNQFGNVKNTASNGNMNYNALQAVLQKRYSSGLQTQMSYTFQKCMTNNDGYYGTWGTATQASPAANYWQNLYDPNSDYAQCYWDTKHVLSAYAVYELPFGRGKRFGHDMPAVANAIAGNWSINPIVSLHSGFPLALYASDASGTGSPSPRPNCNGPVHYPKTVTSAGMQWFDGGAFSQPTSGFGNCPAQGPVIGPSYKDFDISLQKNFLFTERMRLQFRADFLNAFNHPNLGAPAHSVGSAGLGLTNTSQDAREMQFALKFYF
jgi:carboxypeptidase family protein